MIVHKTTGSGISGAVRYVLGEGKRDPVTKLVPELVSGETSRVLWTGGTGFGFPIDSEERLDIARRMMEWAAHNQASPTKRCTEDCLHLVLSWDTDERPSRAEMEAAAHALLKHRGMSHARAIFACHDDTDNIHLHLVISRINPENGKAFPDSYDTLEFSAWALQWEREHGGVRCEARLDREFAQVERDPEKVLAAYTARRETFTAFDLNRELSAAIPTRDTRRQYITGVLARPDMVRLADPGSRQVLRYTTRQTLAAEQIAEDLAARLHSRTRHGVSERGLQQVVAELAQQGKVLRKDQQAALVHATQAEGFAVIVGKAGTGKTFAMSAMAAAYQAEGYAVQSLAPNNKVAAALRRDGLKAATLHSMVRQLDRGQAVWNSKTLVMIDEAGMVSTRLLARAMSYADQAGAKLILIGDDKQLAAIDRGGMYGYLAEKHGSAVLDEIVRQSSADQRELARRASIYDFAGALTSLERQGRLVAVERSEDRIATAGALWGKLSAANPDASLFVVTVSNADAAAVNLAIRDIRRARGELGPDHRIVTADGVQVFATGDRILFSGSAFSIEDRARGLSNGNTGVILGIEGSRLRVALDGAKPGEVLSFTVGKNREAGEFDAFRLGYAGTIYKSQGATFDHAIVIDHPGMRASSAYVALTRHRDSVTVVTADHGADVAALAKKWSRIDDRRAASRFEALDYQPPTMQRYTPAEVRAAVGFETFEKAPGQGPGAPSPRPSVEKGRMDLSPPDDDTLRQQAEREVQALRHLKALDEQAQALRAFEADRIRDQAERTEAFRQQKDREADEIQKREAERRASEDRRAKEGDIASAESRYAVALGTSYDARDPYGSLARAAMSESAMFHRGQEEMRAEMAKEQDPAKREIIELRRRIEGCDYMAITSDRLSGISTAITGRAESGLEDKARAADYRQMATELRQERSALIEAQQAKDKTVTPAQEQVQKTAQTPEAPLPRPRATPAERQQLGALHDAARQPSEGLQRPNSASEQAPASAPEAAAPRPRATPAERQQLGDVHVAAQQAAPQAETQPTRPKWPPERPQSLQAARSAAAQQVSASERPSRETGQAQEGKPAQPAIQVHDETTNRTVALSDYTRDHPREAEAPKRPVDMRAIVNDPAARKKHQQEQFDDIKRSREAEKVVGRIGQDLKEGKPVKGDDLDKLNREQWDRVAKRGDAGLREVVKDGQQKNQDGKGIGREKEPDR